MRPANRFERSKRNTETEWINSPQVRLLNEDGQSEVVNTKIAIERARDQGLDLIIVSPDAQPPVCRIYDRGKYNYEQSKFKKEQDKRNRENAIVIKEIQLRPNIGDHDLAVKQRRTNEFLTEGNKVRIIVKFRGREAAHTQMGFDLIDRFFQGLLNYRCEKEPQLTGNMITALLVTDRSKTN